MIWVHFVMKGAVVMSDDALHAIGPWTYGAQFGFRNVQDARDLLLRGRVQQLVGDGANYLVALVSPGLRGGRIEQAEKTIESEYQPQHESSRSMVI